MGQLSRPPRTRTLAAALASGVLALGLTGCGEDEHAYCVDQDNVVVDPDECERQGGSGFFILHGASLPVNARPGDQLSGGNKISYNDSEARGKAGLPKSGSITSGSGGFGTTIKGKGGFGGFGKSFGG